MHSLLSKFCFSRKITLKCSYRGEKKLINIHEIYHPNLWSKVGGEIFVVDSTYHFYLALATFAMSFLP